MFRCFIQPIRNGRIRPIISRSIDATCCKAFGKSSVRIANSVRCSLRPRERSGLMEVDYAGIPTCLKRVVRFPRGLVAPLVLARRKREDDLVTGQCQGEVISLNSLGSMGKSAVINLISHRVSGSRWNRLEALERILLLGKQVRRGGTSSESRSRTLPSGRTCYLVNQEDQRAYPRTFYYRRLRGTDSKALTCVRRQSP